MVEEAALERAVGRFTEVVREQLERVERMAAAGSWLDFASLRPLRVGFIGGDGIGPIIADQTRRVLEYVLADAVAAGTVEVATIDGLTIENRFRRGQAVPDEVLEAVKTCHVLLKGPTETPQKGDPRGNLESANVSLRRSLDLFANVRPVRVPDRGIDWMFFRENTEGAYILGSRGVEVTPDLAFDFKVITRPGTERIVRAAFEYARRAGKQRVTVVTKANVVKTTDGLFSAVAHEVAQDYPEVRCDEWYIDIMTAKLIDPARQKDFQVLVLPNLYGDILTDEAAQLQGGVGTAGSANLGYRYAMFEAIHGSGNRMVREGRAAYADPSSMMRALAMLLDHIGAGETAHRLTLALDLCGLHERRLAVTGREDGASAAAFTDYVLETLERPDLIEAAGSP
jgi:isocitrate dehydrogenase (NAD+)